MAFWNRKQQEPPPATGLTDPTATVRAAMEYAKHLSMFAGFTPEQLRAEITDEERAPILAQLEHHTAALTVVRNTSTLADEAQTMIDHLADYRRMFTGQDE
jgi:hypothetical protein